MSDLQIILTTFPSQEIATLVIRRMLEERLIACGTLIPSVKSLYHWKGTIEEATEVMAVLKTDQEGVTRSMARLSELHPYEVPEIVVLDPEKVSAPYLAWLKDALRIQDSAVG